MANVAPRAREHGSTPQQPQDLLEFEPRLADDLLALGAVAAGLFARELVARTADREALLVEQAPDLADDDDILALVIAAVAAALHGLELRELLLPITQHMRLDATELGDLADREVTLAGDRRQLVVILGFQHTLRRAPSVFARDGT